MFGGYSFLKVTGETHIDPPLAGLSRFLCVEDRAAAPSSRKPQNLPRDKSYLQGNGEQRGCIDLSSGFDWHQIQILRLLEPSQFRIIIRDP
jgi:hypothetical protein